MEKTQSCFTLWSRACLYFLQDVNQAIWLAEHLVWCIQQKGTSPHDIITGIALTEESEWQPMLLTWSFQHAAGWVKGTRTNVSDFLIPPCMLQAEKGRKIVVMVIPRVFIDLLPKLPDPVSPVYLGAKPKMQTEHLAVLNFETQNLDCQGGMGIVPYPRKVYICSISKIKVKYTLHKQVLCSQSKSIEWIPLNSIIIFNEKSKIIHCSIINEEIQTYWFNMCFLSTNNPP